MLQTWHRCRKVDSNRCRCRECSLLPNTCLESFVRISIRRSSPDSSPTIRGRTGCMTPLATRSSLTLAPRAAVVSFLRFDSRNMAPKKHHESRMKRPFVWKCKGGCLPQAQHTVIGFLSFKEYQRRIVSSILFVFQLSLTFHEYPLNSPHLQRRRLYCSYVDGPHISDLPIQDQLVRHS